MYKILENNLNNFDKNYALGNSKYSIKMHSQAKTSGTKLLEVHGVQKGLDLNLRPEKQHTIPKQGGLERPQMGQGRAGSKRKKPDPINEAINQPSNLSKEIPRKTKIVAGKTNSIHSTNSVSDRLINNNPFMPDVPFHPDPLLGPSKQQPIEQNAQEINPNPNINFDFEENSPYQEGIMSEMFQRPDKSFFRNPKELVDLINKENLVHKFLPKQTDVDKFLETIQRKVLKGTHLPVEVKEIQRGYLYSPYFKDFYLYLSQNKLPSSKSAIRKLETLSEKYVLLDSLLFRIAPEKEKAVLAIPGMCVDKIITLYHKSLFAGHQGVIKTYLTISDKFLIPNLIHYLRSYIKGCHICQLSHNEKPPTRHLQTTINPNYVPMSRLSMDLKAIPRSHKCHGYILYITDEVTNFLITVPIFQARSEEVGEAFIENIITKYCIPEYIIMDQDSAFMSSLMTYIFHKFNIKIKMVAPYNHQSLQAEHGIKSLTHILTKHLTSLGQMWTKYLSLATFAYNTFNSPNLGNYSPYELTFGRKPKLILNVDSNPDIKVSRNLKEYCKLLNKRIKYLQDILFNFKLWRLAMINKDRENFQYKGGDLVYIISPLTSQLRTSSWKIAVKYVGPVVIYKIVDPHNCLIMTLDGKILKGIFEHKRLKPAIIRTNHGNVQNLAELRQIMNTNLNLTKIHSNLQNPTHI